MTRDLTLYNWINKVGIGFTIRQVILGFTLDLYIDKEYTYICYILKILL